MGVRIDKWLWAVRLFKTRSDAAEACRNNKVMIGESVAKPSREVKPGDIISIRKPMITYTFRVVDLVSARQPAKNVEQYMQNITPQEELDKLNVCSKTLFIQRDRGTGRPTKRERREIDSLMENFYYGDDDTDFDE